jgi:hypothetical protein
MARYFARFNKGVSFKPTFPIPHRNRITQFGAKLSEKEEFIGKSHEFEVFLNDSSCEGFEIDAKFTL